MARFYSNFTSLLICCFAIVLVMNSLSSAVVDASGDHQHHMGWLLSGSSPSLVSEEEEFAMDTEINRRILATSSYISYGALRRNTVPCSRRGASYYNCRSGGQANPYNRGCSAITRCRS